MDDEVLQARIEAHIRQLEKTARIAAALERAAQAGAATGEWPPSAAEIRECAERRRPRPRPPR
jgi:hypothetical protein